MKKILIISILITLNMSAQNLSKILGSLESSSKTKAIQEKLNSEIALNEQTLTYAAPIFGANIAQAVPDDAQDGVEYGFSISQDLSHPFSSLQKNISVSEYSKALMQEKNYEIHIHKLEVISAYHGACVSKEMQEKSRLLYEEQSQRFQQIQSAYQLGEISKKDLLFNKLDLVKLQKNVSAYKGAYLKELSFLESLIDNLQVESLECNDLLQPSGDISLNPIEQHSELKMIELKQQSAKALYSLHDSLISSLEYELSYEKELDTKIYGFGISIPLNSLSSEQESLKAQQYSLSASYTHEKDALQFKVENYSKNAIVKLGVIYDEYTLMKDEILPLNTELLQLSKLALLEGEGDIMEYLDASRSYSLNLIEMLEIKKSYYEELFELYKIADLEYGEKK